MKTPIFTSQFIPNFIPSRRLIIIIQSSHSRQNSQKNKKKKTLYSLPNFIQKLETLVPYFSKRISPYFPSKLPSLLFWTKILHPLIILGSFVIGKLWCKFYDTFQNLTTPSEKILNWILPFKLSFSNEV